MAVARRRAAVRAAGALAVVAVHVLIVAMLLQTSVRRDAHAPAPQAERILWLPSLARKRTIIPARQEMTGRIASHARPALPDYRGITIPDSQASPTLGLNRSVFGCSPQELADMPPEDRARCANAITPDDSVDFRDGTSRSQSAALWERRRERKNAPLLLPCMSPQAPPGLGTILCLAKGAMVGLDLDQQPSYADTPEQLHLPNNGDPPDHP